VATQSFTRRAYGPVMLDRIASGDEAKAALHEMLGADTERRLRQVGVVTAGGVTAAWTGYDCIKHASHLEGQGFAVQGNMTTSESVIATMAEAYRGAMGPLAERMLAALRAGEAAGGDLRGRQSAAVLVASASGDAETRTGVEIDLRVDDHRDPVAELSRLLDVRRRYEAAGAAGRAGDGPAAAEAWARLVEVAPSPIERAVYEVLALACAGQLDAGRALASRTLAAPAVAGYVHTLVREGSLPHGDVLTAAGGIEAGEGT
jgi:uncharacterized Ntn-hydrolase superfamily protein